MNLFNHGMNGIKAMTGAGAAAAQGEETTSTKRKPTAYDNAVLNQTLASTAQFIEKYQNGGLNLFGSNTSTSSNATTTSDNTNNLFVNKKKVEE